MIHVRDEEILEQNLLKADHEQQIEDLKRANSAWYRNPWIWGAVGVAAGIYLDRKL